MLVNSISGEKRGEKRFSPITIMSMMLILLGGLLSTFNSSLIILSLFGLSKIIFTLFGLSIIGRDLFDQGLTFDKIFKYWLIGAQIFSLLVINDYLRGSSFMSGPEYRDAGLAGHVTNAGGILAIALSIRLRMKIKAGFLYWKVIQISSIALALILTGTISAYIAFICSILINAKRVGSIKRVVLVITQVIAILTIILILQKFMIYDFSGRFIHASTGRYSTIDSRLMNLGASIHEIFYSAKDFFIGRGLDGYAAFVYGSNGEYLQTHNLVLQAWMQGGFLFLVGILIYLIKAFNHKDNVEEITILPIKTAATTALIFSMTSPLLFARYIWIPIVLLVAYRSSIKNEMI